MINCQLPEKILHLQVSITLKWTQNPHRTSKSKTCYRLTIVGLVCALKSNFYKRVKQPFGVSFGHCNHDCAMQQHFHIDHTATELPNDGSNEENQMVLAIRICVYDLKHHKIIL